MCLFYQPKEDDADETGSETGSESLFFTGESEAVVQPAVDADEKEEHPSGCPEKSETDKSEASSDILMPTQVGVRQ